MANLLKALELARQLETAGVRSLRAFVRRLRDTVLGGIEEEPSPASEESENVVRILTMHKAKGLEFPVVVLPDLAGRSSDSGAKLLFRRDGGCELRFASRRTAGFDDAVEKFDFSFFSRFSNSHHCSFIIFYIQIRLFFKFVDKIIY